MILVIILGLFSVLFAFLAKNEDTKWGLKVSFALIFLFLSLRYDYGNDYETYLNAFIEINRRSEIGYFDNSLYRFEIGWLYLNRLFGPLGFFAMTAVLALFNCVAYYYFIKKYVPVRCYWIAIFIYIFYPEFMLIHASAMRQSIAIIFFIFSLDYLYKKDVIRYFLCIGIASLFHISALILLPVFLLSLVNRRIYIVIGIVFVSIYASIILFAQSLSPYVISFINNFFVKYAGFEDAGVVNSGFGLIYFGVMSILTVYFLNFQNKETALIFLISIISAMIIPFNMIIGLIGRIGMYFTPATIITYSIMPVNLKKTISKTIYLTLLITATTYRFFQFFNSDTYKNYYEIYQTVFSAPQWY